MSGTAGALSGTVEVRPGIGVTTLVGDVVPGSLPRLRALLDAAAAADGDVVVDLSSLGVLGHDGLAALVGASVRLSADGRSVAIRGARPEVQAYLRAARFAGLLEPTRRGQALMGGLTARAAAEPTRAVLDAALQLVVTLAQAVMANADGVSITLPRDGTYGTVAASDDVVLAMDHDQYTTGQGPCLDAARQGEPFQADALAREHRWPDFVPRARARGIESILSSPLHDAGQAHGALNIYARTAGAFAGPERSVAEQFAAEASAVLTAAQHALPSPRQSGHLETALESRDVIARAQGFVMHRDGVSAEAAWSSLTATSRGTSRPLREVCEALVGMWSADGPA